MSSLVGFVSLSTAIGINIFIIISNFFLKMSYEKFNILNRSSTALIIISFFSLMYAYITSDFSNFNVFQNSHSNKPLIYKISGTWGNHEGSMLLWISILSIYGFLFSFSKNLNLEIKKITLLIQSFLQILFGLFIVITSNPFLVNSLIVKEGLGLNPILQDPGLAIHPPVLYAGYVGYSIVFSLAIAGLFIKDKSSDWINETKK